MKSGKVTRYINASANDVFKVIHDYTIRLQWDTLLSEARLLNGIKIAAKGAVTRCVGKGWMRLFPIEAVYLTFIPGVVVAVEMVNRSLLFSKFSASIRHAKTEIGSCVVYQFAFSVHPWLLAPLLEPLVRRKLYHEVGDRLDGLKHYCEAIQPFD